jgi:ribosome-associated protein
VDTLRELRSQYGADAPLAWLVGADSLRQLHTWHRWRDLCEHAHLLVVQRPGADIETAALHAIAPEVAALVGERLRPVGALPLSPHGGIAILPLPGLRPESSTELRRRIARGEPWAGWVPPAVAGYIVRHRLYRDPAVILPDVASPPLIEPAPLTTTAHVIKTSLPTPPPSVETLLKTVHAALEELKAKDTVEIDVRGKSSVCDYMVVASGTSTRHVKSIADEVVRFAKKLDVMPLGVEGEREAEWVLVDLGDVVVHVMLPRVREFYALERLWTVGDQHPDYVASDA